MRGPTDPLFTLAGERAADRPRFLGWILRRYAEAEGMTPEALAEHLGLSASGISALSLCFRPRTELFAADIHAVADRIGVDETLLANVVRQVEALESLPADHVASGDRGLLLAARERPPRLPQEDGEPRDQ